MQASVLVAGEVDHDRDGLVDRGDLRGPPDVLRKLFLSPGGPDVAEMCLPVSVAMDEWPSGSSGRLDRSLRLALVAVYGPVGEAFHRGPWPSDDESRRCGSWRWTPKAALKDSVSG